MAGAPHATPLTYLLIGNPGVGKSTILNGLLRKPVFRSGVSFGSGMTYRLDTYTDEATGCTYADTPGLADTEKRTQAAAAITTALKAGGRFRIFFVITLEQGRVKPEDVATMKLVLDAAPIDSYAIIINQANRKEHRELTANPSQLSPSPADMVFQQLLARLRPEKRSFLMHIMHRDPDLDGADDVAKALPEELLLFMTSLPVTQFTPEEVTKVREDEFEQEREESQQKISDLLRKNESMDSALKMTEAEVGRLRQQTEAHQQAFRDLQTQMAQQAKDHEANVGRLVEEQVAGVRKENAELLEKMAEKETEQAASLAEMKKVAESNKLWTGVIKTVFVLPAIIAKAKGEKLYSL